jgi:indolepyruvate ferredoxin oxidoreductase beta subunit
MAHIILGFEAVETLRASRKFSSNATTVLINPAPVPPMLVAQGLQAYPEIGVILSELDSLNESVHLIRATELAQEAGDAIALNVVMLGALCGLNLLPFEREAFVDAVVGKVPEKYQELNQRAFDAGFEEGRKQLIVSR